MGSIIISCTVSTFGYRGGVGGELGKRQCGALVLLLLAPASRCLVEVGEAGGATHGRLPPARAPPPRRIRRPALTSPQGFAMADTRSRVW
jgi:hypothetical protein